MFKYLFLIVFSLIPNSNAASYSKSEIKKLDPVIVTSTVYPKKIRNNQLNTITISQEHIQNSKAKNLREILITVPGLYIDQRGGLSGTSSVYIRGGDPNFTVVMLDGIELNNPSNSRGGSFDFSTISTANIERIEIIKGPLSVIYGSGAISGIINIITKKGVLKPKLSADISISKDTGYSAIVESRGIYNKLNYSIAFSHLNDGKPVEESKFNSSTFISNFGWIVKNSLEIETLFRYAWIDNESFPDDSGGPEFSTIRIREKNEQSQLTAGVNINQYYKNWLKQIFTLSFFHTKEHISSPGVAPGIRDPFGIPSNSEDLKYSRYEFKQINSIFIDTNIVLSVGLDGRFEKGLNKGKIFEKSTNFKFDRFSFGSFAELQLKPISNLDILIGGRLDFSEDFDPELSPRLGINYYIKKTETTLEINFSKGFKLPSFFALGNSIVGNDKLNPEKGSSFDFGISQNLFDDKLTMSLSYFHNKFENLIDLDEGPPPKLVNRSEVISEGFEAGTEIKPFKNLKIFGNLSYTKTDIKNSNDKLRNRPNWLGSISPTWWPRKSIVFYANGNYVGESLDSSIPTGDVTLDGYFRVDTALTWKVNNNLKAYLAIENLFDETYEQFVGFEAPGIRPRIGIQGTL